MSSANYAGEEVAIADLKEHDGFHLLSNARSASTHASGTQLVLVFIVVWLQIPTTQIWHIYDQRHTSFSALSTEIEDGSASLPTANAELQSTVGSEIRAL